MAAFGRSLFGLRNTLKVGATRGLLRPQNKPGGQFGSARTVLVTKSGAVLPKPEKISFGLLKIFVVVIPFLYMGTLISKNFASLLEEHDIFVPADDDDDD